MDTEELEKENIILKKDSTKSAEETTPYLERKTPPEWIFGGLGVILIFITLFITSISSKINQPPTLPSSFGNNTPPPVSSPPTTANSDCAETPLGDLSIVQNSYKTYDLYNYSPGVD